MTETAVAASPEPATPPLKRRRKPAFAMFCWTVVAIAAVISGISAILDLQAAQSAPQQAAAASMALLIAIVPYVFARAVDEMTRD